MYAWTGLQPAPGLSDSVPNSASRPPAKFGDRYVVDRELGRGGAATVYVALDAHLGRTVAVKVLRQDVAHVLGHQRFLREIRIASQLRHPNIMPVLDFGETDGMVWYVMPHVTTGTLRDRLDSQTQLRIEDAIRWTAEIADALAYAHDHDFVHRDVKPENILIDGEHAVLADFGIARAMHLVGGDTLTSAGIAVGTPAYMSPEQATGAKDVDGRTDVYSLSCVLYECLTGVQPFVGPNAQSVIAQRFAQAPHPVTSFRSTVPVPVQEAIEDGMNVVPADRLTARELASALGAAYTVSTTVPGRRASRQVPKVEASAGTPRRQRALLAGAGVVAAVTLGVWLKPGGSALSDGKVAVFPVTVTGDAAATQFMAGVPSLIGVALDGIPSLQWIEGTDLLDGAESTDSKTRNAERARAARGAGAGYYIDGTMVTVGDSVSVVMRLVRTETDSIVARARAAARGGANDAPPLALRAVGQLLPRLIATGGTVDLSALSSRKPEAIAAYLLGEQAYRNGRDDEALAKYEEALALDSNLAIAALKAARSARSLFNEAGTRRFVALALARDSLLPGANGHFARGLAHFYRHFADSAVTELQRAAALAPQSAEIQSALGDVYFYQGVDGLRSDSAARVHYRLARATDAKLATSLAHLILLAGRQRDTTGLRMLLAEYGRITVPDTQFVRRAQVTLECQTRGPNSVRWDQLAVSSAPALVQIGKDLAGAGADLTCAKPAAAAVFAKPGQPSRDHFGALLVLNAVAVAQGDTATVRRAASTPMGSALRARNLVVLNAVAEPSLRADAEAAVAAMLPDVARLSPEELWILGVWFAHVGRVADLTVVLAQIEARVAAPPFLADSLMVKSLRARLLLQQGDTTAAVTMLSIVNPDATFQNREWRLFEPRAADNMLLAHIASAQQRHRDVVRIAGRLDQAYAIANLAFLRESLTLRRRSAERDGDVPLVQLLSRRLAALSPSPRQPGDARTSSTHTQGGPA